MKTFIQSLCLLPMLFSTPYISAMNPVDHRRQLIIESQIIQIRDTLIEYQPIMDHFDYENILYNLYVIEVMMH